MRLGIGFGRRDRFGRRGVPLGVLNAGRRRRPKPNTPLRGGPPHRPKLWDVGFGRRRIRRRGRDVRRGIGFGRRRHICRRGRDLCLGVGFGRRKRVGRDIGQHGRLGIGFGRRLHFGRPGRTACLMKCPASRIPRVAALIYRNSGTPHGVPSMIFSAREYPGGQGGECATPEDPGPDPRPQVGGACSVIPDKDRASNGIRPASGSRCLAAPDLIFNRDANGPRRFASKISSVRRPEMSSDSPWGADLGVGRRCEKARVTTPPFSRNTVEIAVTRCSSGGLPPPLRGRVGVGGGPRNPGSSPVPRPHPPHPALPRKGEGDQLLTPQELTAFSTVLLFAVISLPSLDLPEVWGSTSEAAEIETRASEIPEWSSAIVRRRCHG